MISLGKGLNATFKEFVVSSTDLMRALDGFDKKFPNLKVRGFLNCSRVDEGNVSKGLIIESREVPDENKVFCFGFDIGTTSGYIYITNREVDTDIAVGSFIEYLADILKRPISVDNLVSAIQCYKLSGKFDEFIDRLSSGIGLGGSVVGSFVIGDGGGSGTLTEKDILALTKATVRLGNGVRMFSRQVLDHLKECGTSLYTPEELDALYRVASCGCGAGSWFSAGDSGVTEDVANLYRYSSKSFMRNGYADYSVGELKAMQLVEVMDSCKSGDEVIYSKDLRKSLRDIGMDKVVTSREMTSLVQSASKYMEDILRGDSFGQSGVGDSRFVYGSQRSSTGSEIATSVSRFMTSLKQLTKIAGRLAKAGGSGD